MTTTVSQSDTSAHPASGSALATLGLLMAAAGPLLFLLATLVFGLSADDVGFFVVVAVLALVGAFLIRQRHTAAKVVACVLALLAGGALFWTAFGLAAPASFFDFVPGLLVLPGALLGLVSGITSIVRTRRGREVGGGERRAVGAIVAVVALLAVVSAVLTVTGRDTVPDALADEADLTVHLEDFEFDEASYSLEGGATVLVKNDDPFIHTFTVDELDIDVDLGPSSEKLIEIPEESGTFVLYCEPHTSDKDDPAEDDMVAELTVG
jgi:plastocyanin